MHVELISARTSDGVRLDGYLRTPPAGAAPRLGVDAVICHHGVGGTFYGESFFDPIGDRLLEQGCAVLRVNNRGHDRAYHARDGRRLGAMYEVLDDARLDFRAWADFAEARGYRRLAIWGHSLGAVKTVYVLAADPDPRVQWSVATSPPRFDHQAYLASPQGSGFRETVARAQELVDGGAPEAPVEALIPQPGLFSARTYLDKYGPGSPFDYFRHLENVRSPLLLTVGSLERDDVSFTPLAEQGARLAEQGPARGFALIEGADHFYLQHVDQLWAAARDWLDRVRVGAPA